MTVLVAAIAGRSLAAAASRAGERVIVADFFGDLDTRALADWLPLAGDLEMGVAAGQAATLTASLPTPIAGIVYDAGFERDPARLAELSAVAPLLGNPPSVVEAVKDPQRFAALLASLDLPHPAIAQSPASGRDWLVKARGGAGGTHVRPAERAAGVTAPGWYYQERVPGRPVSALFVADGKRAAVIGFSEQWTAPVAESPFRFGGAVAPALLPQQVRARLAAACDAITRETGLVGLNSLDTLLDGEDFRILEINPRPGATLDLFDGVAGISLWRLHLRGVAGDVPGEPLLRSQMAPRAAAIAYAAAELIVPAGFEWPGWTADRSSPGSHIPAGAPVCTVLAEAASVGSARSLAETRASRVPAMLGEAAPRFSEAV